MALAAGSRYEIVVRTLCGIIRTEKTVSILFSEERSGAGDGALPFQRFPQKRTLECESDSAALAG